MSWCGAEKWLDGSDAVADHKAWPVPPSAEFAVGSILVEMHAAQEPA